MSPDTSNRGSARHVTLAVLVALVVTVGAVAPVVAGASSSGGVYQISGMDVPESVTTNESFSVSATLSNSGTIDMQVVAFRIDANGDGEFTPNESLGAEAFVLLDGASRNVTFDVAVPDGLAPGEYEYMLYTESGTETGTITVESPIAPATFLLSGVSGPESVAGGESFAVETSVANVGDLNGSETLSLYLDTDGDGNLTDEAALANTTFELASASNGSVGLNATAPEVTPGEYTYAVGTSTEMLTGTVNVTEPPAQFDVISLRGGRTMVGSSLSVSTIVENVGDEERTGTVEIRLDTNGDGEFSASETVRTRELSLGVGASQQHGFSVALPDSYSPGEYEVALVTPTTERVETFEVYRPVSTSSSSSSSSSAGGSEEITREAIAQQLYGQSYASLDVHETWQVEDVYDRLPLADGTSLSDLESIEQVSQRLYGESFTVDSMDLQDKSQYALTTEQARTVVNTYDSQFGPLPTDPAYTLDGIANGMYQDDFENMPPWKAANVQMVYNRQPLADSEDDYTVKPYHQLLSELMDSTENSDGYLWVWQNLNSEPDLTKEDVLEAQDQYEDQFKESS